MKRNLKLAAALTVCVALTLTGCASSFTKTAYNSLHSLKTAYVITKAARTEYCHPKDPQPKICADSYKPLLAAYMTIKDGTALLLVYEANKDETTKVKLQALIPLAAAQVVEILGMQIEFGVTDAPPPPAK